jgi:hypothetical protein
VGGVILFRQTGGHFIGGRGLERRCPEGGRGGCLATCTGKAGCGGLGGVLEGFGRGVGALWAGVGELTPVGSWQGGRGARRGGSGCFLPVFHVSQPGSGQGRLGLDRGEVHGYGYRARAHELGVIHSDFDFNEICPPSARSNARMNFKFEFLKTANVGGQDIS